MVLFCFISVEHKAPTPFVSWAVSYSFLDPARSRLRPNGLFGIVQLAWNCVLHSLKQQPLWKFECLLYFSLRLLPAIECWLDFVWSRRIDCQNTEECKSLSTGNYVGQKVLSKAAASWNTESKIRTNTKDKIHKTRKREIKHYRFCLFLMLNKCRTIKTAA